MCEIPSNPAHLYQAGIVVGGVGCGEKEVPGFYADVGFYRDWIDRKFVAEGLDSSSYKFE